MFHLVATEEVHDKAKVESVQRWMLLKRTAQEA
jgi:hypothetical protein